MGDGVGYLQIIVFAAIAGFLAFRLFGVLGRRTGNERPPPRTLPPLDQAATTPPQLRPLPGTGDGAGAAARLKGADKNFDVSAFLKGARAAFEIIVNAFAKGDTNALRPLLSESVYASFADAISQRAAAQQTQETRLLAIKAVELAGSEVQDGTAFVTVRIVSDQTNVIRAADGGIVDGNPDQSIEKTDLWTFARALRSQDPNWTLVATQSP
jgi:predicted lipid-binding transport protein (Tim44 family)